MITPDLNQLLLWILRFAYPLIIVLLARNRWIWNWRWFGLYLIAVSAAAWTYDPQSLSWTAPAAIPAMILKAFASYEVLQRIYEDEPIEHARFLAWILPCCGIVLAAMTLGLQYNPHDSSGWVIYKTLRVWIHVGVWAATLAGLLYGLSFGCCGSLTSWPHAILWTCYLTLYVVGGITVPRTGFDWQVPVTFFRIGSLICLAGWIVLGLKQERTRPQLYPGEPAHYRTRFSTSR